jgi:alpha-tubulin suppressor-like RCC1 family protein
VAKIRRSLAPARTILATVALSAALALTAATPASAAALVTPDSGPATGGTTVSLAAAALGFSQVAQGENTGYGLDGDGHVYSWGDNGGDEFGDGGAAASSIPVRVLQGAIPNGVAITQIAAGWQSGYGLGSDGKVYAWGTNSSGQLGDGTTTTRTQPVAIDVSGVAAGVRFTHLAASAMDAYAIASDGTIYAWGYGADGELGNGSTANSDSPVVVSAAGMPAGVVFSQVAAGGLMAFGIGTDGHVYSWGWNGTGSLGDGSTANSDVPVPLSTGAIGAGVTIAQVAAGQEGGYALGSDGHVYDWGSNLFGDLGDGSTTDSSVPVQVVAGQIPAGVSITAIGAGSASGYGIGSDDHVYAWGIGGNGQLGNGASSDSSTPVVAAAGAVPAGVHLETISGGYHSVIALGTDDRVYGWGDNNSGDTGDGTTTQRDTPVLGANADITSVTFGGVAGTDVVDPPGVTTVVTGAHSAGVVAVVVSGSINGGAAAGAATSVTLPGAFTFTATLAPTGVVLPWWLLAVGCAAIAIGAALVSQGRRPRRSTSR